MIEKSKHSITFHPIVQMCLEEGGYVAGGAARALYLRKNMQEYFQIGDHGPKNQVTEIEGFKLSFPVRKKTAGDIDIFFPDKRSQSAALERLNSVKAGGHHYATALSNTFHVSLDARSKRQEDAVAVQLIHCVFGQPEDMISNFDFVNCSVAVNSQGFFYDSLVPDLEKRSTLKIRRADSTQLLKRIMKYMHFRELQSVDDSTREMITDWILRYISDDFEGPMAKLTSKPNIRMLENSIKMGVMDKSHLTYLVNRSEFDRPLVAHNSVSDDYRVVGKTNQVNDLISKIPD